MMSTGIIQGNQASINVIKSTLDVASVSANTSAEQTFTVAGLKLGDFVSVVKPSLSAGLVVGNARVSAANTLAITFGNLTASPINPAAEEYFIFVARSEGTGPAIALSN